MSMEQTKIALPVTRFIHTEKRQLLCEGSALLSDARFAGARILHADASVRMGAAEITGDQLSVEGVVLFDVLYTGGDEPLGSAQAQYAFTHVFDAPDAAPGMRANAYGRVDSVTATLTGARIGLNAVVTLWAEGEATEPADAVTALQGAGMQTLSQNVAYCGARIHGLKRMLLQGDDELPVPTSGPVRYFTHRMRIQHTEMRDGYARVQGDLVLDACHSGDALLVQTHHAFPFDLDVPLEHAGADYTVRAQASAQELAVTVTPADDPQGLGVLHVEGTLVCQVLAEHPDTAEILSDAYATGAETLELAQTRTVLYAGSVETQAASTAHLTLETPADQPAVADALAAFASPVHLEATDAHGAVAGMLRVCAVYAGTDGALYAIPAEVPFETRFDADTPPDAQLTLSCGEVTASGSGDRVEVRVQLLLEASQVRQQEVLLVTDAQTHPLEQPEPVHIAVRFARPGDTLWSIAKAHRVPLDTLSRLNPAVSALNPGDKLILLCGGEPAPEA